MPDDPDPARSRMLCRGALVFVLTATAITVAGTLSTGDKQTIVRITQPVEAGEYLAADRIEAVTRSIAAGATYVTPDQATVGLIASHTLQPGDLPTVSDVYTTSPTPSAKHPRESWTLLRWLLFGTLMGLLAAKFTASIDRLHRLLRRHSDTNSASTAGTTDAAPMECGAHNADKASYESAERTRDDGTADAAGAQPQVDRDGGQFTGCSAQRVPLDPVRVPGPTAVTVGGGLNGDLSEPPEAGSDDVSQVLTRARGLRGVPGEQGDAIGDHVLRPVAAAARTETSSAAAPALTRSAEPVRRFTLRVFGEVTAEGASTQALAVPLVVAFAGRAMSNAELAEITGYSLRTLSTVFTANHPLVRRVDGRLTLRHGVWTEYGWIAECVRQAEEATAAGKAAGARWLRQAINEASKIGGAPFDSPPPNRMRRDPYRWVDDFPVDVSARVRAGQELVEAVLAALELWSVCNVANVVPASQLVEVCCRLAELVPYAPVADQVRPSPWQSAGECLLVAAYRVGSIDQQLRHAVQSQAKRLVATGVIEASDRFADELGL